MAELKEERIILASEQSNARTDVKDKKAEKKRLRATKRARKEEEELNKSTLRAIMEYVRVIAIGALIAVFLSMFIIINARIPSGSMIPTLNIEDRMIGLRFVYYFSDPERGDVVIFKTPNTDPGEYNKLYVKRVIGLPGETVEISAGKVIIHKTDGTQEYLVEDYLNETPTPDIAINNKSYTLGDDEYFVMGDNRNASNDSRYWGAVSRDRILAKGWFKYYKGFELVK